MTGSVRGGLGFITSTLLLLPGCGERRAGCADCGTVVVAAISEPVTLLPPLIGETVGRDISDQVYERLAYLAPDIVRAIVDGRQPRSLNARTLARLGSLPLSWSEQRAMLGFAAA